ncbi:regulatory or redox protein complexing with Bfr, in iron storage and mobility [Noviherbaspirillum cavernae]|uniref:Bacterioferritin-associated ferredoxin n=1 Tax=Noviherbaspirillum cavernae TaxID=2320862 RepID=A0A418X3V4_9BURK|nr:(2Fe-2S)-binding protein [Noviherbaspirillum cavernae]RJG07106.1 regulatory or redox protein complexing with Bfr, in iron storage and mobility [Noviherbaspirillum cavernae]
MIVCICNNVSERKIRQAVDGGMTSMPQLRDCLSVGTCCGKCHPHAKQVLRECVADIKQKTCAQEQPLVFHCNALAA